MSLSTAVRLHFFCSVSDNNPIFFLNNGWIFADKSFELESTMTDLPTVLFVLGPPGSGKGTQCSKLTQKYGLVHLSAGDLLRAEKDRPGSEYGSLIETYIREGTIIPVEITCRLIQKAMKERDSKKFLIDGFPRNKDNLDGWLKEMSNACLVAKVIVFNCDEETCIKRCLNRGDEGSGRTDDNLESLKKRFTVFYNDTMPIIKYYEERGSVANLDGTKDPEDVFQDVCVVVDAL